MAKASEYEYVLKSRYINDGNVPMYVGYNGITDAEGTDWWDETMRKTALIHNYNLSRQVLVISDRILNIK